MQLCIDPQGCKRVYPVLHGVVGALILREIMAELMSPSPQPEPRRKYSWPWFALGGVLLGILLAVLWMSREIERTRRLREGSRFPASSPSTNAPAPTVNR